MADHGGSLLPFGTDPSGSIRGIERVVKKHDEIVPAGYPSARTK